jgi:hypothetical protein
MYHDDIGLRLAGVTVVKVRVKTETDERNRRLELERHLCTLYFQGIK